MRWLAAASSSLGTHADPSPSTYMNTHKHKRSIVPLCKNMVPPCSHRVANVDLPLFCPPSAVNYKLRLSVPSPTRGVAESRSAPHP